MNPFLYILIKSSFSEHKGVILTSSQVVSGLQVLIHSLNSEYLRDSSIVGCERGVLSPSNLLAYRCRKKIKLEEKYGKVNFTQDEGEKRESTAGRTL